jgi:hypothetical protein
MINNIKPFAIIDVSEYDGRPRRIMDKAGYLKTELYHGKKTIKIALFSDGTTIDSRKGKFLDKFYKKCYNE